MYVEEGGSVKVIYIYILYMTESKKSTEILRTHHSLHVIESLYNSTTPLNIFNL
jgi:hypothetical protein